MNCPPEQRWIEEIYEDVFIKGSDVDRRVFAQRRARLLAKDLPAETALNRIFVREYLLGTLNLSVMHILCSLNMNMMMWIGLDIEALCMRRSGIGVAKAAQMMRLQDRHRREL